jgi:hypothetical protein
MRSPLGPAMAYALAEDAWHPEGQNILAHFESIKDNPLEQARAFGQMEQAFKDGAAQGSRQAPPRATQAPPPIRPVSGGSGGSKDLHSLAQSDDVSAYAKARGKV